MRIKITGLDDLKRAANFVRDIPAASQRAAYRAINSTIDKVMTQSRRDIAAEINLPQAYIREQMSAEKASPSSTIAYVRVRMRAIRLARFDARQITATAKHRDRSRGDARRGIPKGKKAAGVSVKVTRRGGRTSRKAGFLIPLRSGAEPGGNGMGVFVRTGPGPNDIEHVYSRASPHSLFRRWKEEHRDEVMTMLREAYASQLRYELTGRRK